MAVVVRPLVLIVDDDVEKAGALARYLSAAELDARLLRSGAAALAAAWAEPAPDVVILELALPDVAGTEVCRRLRGDDRTRDLPILMYSSRTDELARIVGFEVGADDFVAKPFSAREVVLRIRALLRRTTRTASTPLLRVGVLVIDRDAHRVWVEDAELSLTALEFRLLVAFIDRHGRVQTREGLLSEVWEMSVGITTRTVDTNVKRLREKLGVAGDLIETVRGVGYRFRVGPDGT